jgi:hypothetical protein
MSRQELQRDSMRKPYRKPTLTKEKQLREITAGDLPVSQISELGCTKQHLHF